MRRSFMVWLAVGVMVAGVSCVPPSPSPTLPRGVGVQWLRDTGGDVAPTDGRYAPAYDRYSVLDGVVTGPSAAGSTPAVIAPGLMFFQHMLPDGTAMYPYNGFAGEGVVGMAVAGIITLTFPGGSCRISHFDTASYLVFPSPDFTKAAVSVSDSSADFSGVTIVSLVNGGECPELTHDGYITPSGGGDHVYPPAVWAPDSTAIAYTIADTTPDPQTQRIVRLAATTGATPSDVIPATPANLTPLGWSIGGRILVRTYLYGSDEVTLSTLPAAGGTRRVLDRWSLAGSSTPIPQSVGSYFFAYYLGYFAPGSTTVVYSGATSVTNSTGQTYPWFRLRRIADAAGAASSPLVSPTAQLSWHQEAIDPISGPPFTMVDVPNSELLERFVH